MKKLIFLALVAIAFVSCEKNAGKGGTSTIKGTITVWEYNKDFTVRYDEYAGQDIDVYIMYGDEEIYGDKFETDFEGKYEFNYLQEGKYTIYAYSKDTTNYITNELTPVFREVEITGKDQTIEVPEIIIYE